MTTIARPEIAAAHRGYFGLATFDPRSGLYRGRALNLERDAITFGGATPQEVRAAFARSIEDYLQMCAERGEQPERSGEE